MSSQTLESGKTPFGYAQLKSAYDAFASEADAKAVPDWVLNLRESGARVWETKGLPTRQDERWKYTNLNVLLEGSWQPAEALAADELPSRSRFPQYEGEKAAEIVLLNGRFIPEWSSVKVDGLNVRMANDLEALPLAAAYAEGAPQNAGVPFAHAPIQDALNASFARDVIAIDIKPAANIKKPIVITSYSFGSESLNAWSVASPRVVITVGKVAEVAFVEFSSGEGRTLALPSTTIRLEKGARVSHARINASKNEAAQLGYTRIDLTRDSFCETYQFSLSGRLSREDLDIRLLEPGAEAVLDGLYLVDGKRHADHSTTVDHFAPQTLSSQLYKGILADDSRAVFNGRVRIHRDAQQSNAAQLNNNLLLSKRAEADTKPELEIDADDVKASHGATIGQLDPEHIFYLRARAIPEREARGMLARGFAQDVAFRIRNEALRDGATRAVDKALANVDLGGLNA
jgi:Fe-S cluster assembly protein SufD